MSVLVTDASGNHALAVVRSLGRRGLRVIAAETGRLAQAGFSRFCAARALYPSPVRGVREFQEGLHRLLDVHRPDLLMPMTERTILAMGPMRREIDQIDGNFTVSLDGAKISKKCGNCGHSF